jgi:hypothetical protein
LPLYPCGGCQEGSDEFAIFSIFPHQFLKVVRAWGANPGSFDLVYFLIFHHCTAEPQRPPPHFFYILVFGYEGFASAPKSTHGAFTIFGVQIFVTYTIYTLVNFTDFMVGQVFYYL